MRVTLLSLCLSLICSAVSAFEIEDETMFEVTTPTASLRIISTADTDLFTPLVLAFQDQNPGIEITYTAVSSAELMVALHGEGASFDVAVSSAMDLQTKLANDGLTLPHRSTATALVPDWGKWRDHVFAFTQESAAIVVSPTAFEGLEIPRTRQGLIDLLREHSDRFRGRVGTYDIRTSGLGYLFATQDARNAETYWRLMETMGNLNPELYCCSSDMIEDVASGRVAVAYNVLGSYAEARTDLTGRIEIIEPEDFTTVMLRSALIPTTAENPDIAGDFIDHLIQMSWGQEGEGVYPFPDIAPLTDPDNAALRPIRLGPGLLVYLDTLKRARFLGEWENAVLRN